MIERLQRIASVLHSLRLLIIGAALLALLAFSMSLLELGGLNTSEHLIPSLLSLCWTITLYSCANLFLHVPAPAEAGTGFWRRWQRKFRRGLFWILGLFMVGLSLSLLLLSYQLLRAWLTA